MLNTIVIDDTKADISRFACKQISAFTAAHYNLRLFSSHYHSLTLGHTHTDRHLLFFISSTKFLVMLCKYFYSSACKICFLVSGSPLGFVLPSVWTPIDPPCQACDFFSDQICENFIFHSYSHSYRCSSRLFFQHK